MIKNLESSHREVQIFSRRSERGLVTVLFGICIFIGLSSPTTGELIPIINPSFEQSMGPRNTVLTDASGALKDGKQTSPIWQPAHQDVLHSGAPIPGWLVTYGGTYNPLAAHFARVPHGQNIAWLALQAPTPPWVAGSPAVSQVLCRVLEPGIYTLKCSVGRSVVAPNYAGYVIQLLAGGVVIAEDFNSKNPSGGTFETSETNVVIPDNHPQIGGVLEIRLGGAHPPGTIAHVYFDNVSLDGPASSCRMLANSISEFTSSQGSNGWYYGYFDRGRNPQVSRYDPVLHFSELPNPHNALIGNAADAANIWNPGQNFYTALGAAFGIPNSGTLNANLPPREHWVIRRWVSRTTGLVRIHGWLAKMYPYANKGIDGLILINGTSVFERHIDGLDIRGVNYSVGANLQDGDLVDFVIKPGNDILGSFAYFTALIEQADKLPVIVVGPQSQSSCPGQSVSFSVVAGGAEPLSFQWYANGAMLAGETNQTLTLVNLQPMNAGEYYVKVSNPLGSVTSDPALLRVFDACLDIQMYAGLNVVGQVGETYVVRYTTDIGNTNFETWIPIATNRLSSSTWFFPDFDSAGKPTRYYGVRKQP